MLAAQRTAPRARSRPSPRRSACSASTAPRISGYLVEVAALRIAKIGYQELVRAASATAWQRWPSPARGRRRRAHRAGRADRGPAAAIALAVGTWRCATRRCCKVLEKRRSADPIELLREAFDMLEEDFEEERFFVAVRRTYWQAAEHAHRRTAEALIRKLEF